MSFINKKPANTFKDILQINNGNSGISASLKQVKSGSDDGSSLYISEDNIKTQPSADSTTSVVHYDKDGNALLTIDSVNDMIKSGISQHHINTQYAHFGDNFVYTASFIADYHYPIGFDNQVRTTTGGDIVNIGNGTNPDTSLTISNNAQELVGRFWYVPDNMVIDSAFFWVGADASSGDTIRCHLMAYDIVTTAGATGGDLSNGVVVADGADIVNAGYEQAYYQSMTIQSSSVSAGKALFFTFRQDGVNSDYSISATIKYHLI